MARFIPDGFDPPEKYHAGGFRLEILGPDLLASDFEAYMSSVAHLQGVFGPDEDWPRGVTVELALIDVCWCRQEWISRRSFSYAVLDPAETLELGCVYVTPCPKTGFDAQLMTWVRKSAADEGFDPVLFDWAKRWVATDWPFERAAYPGREIDWDAWKAMEEKPI